MQRASCDSNAPKAAERSEGPPNTALDLSVWRCAVIKQTRTILTGIVILVGLILMVGGIITHKHGAVVVGLIVAAVATQQLITARNSSKQVDK